MARNHQDPNSTTRPAGGVDCNRGAMTGLGAWLIIYEVPRCYSFLSSVRGPGKLKNGLSSMRATAKPAPAVINRITSSV